MRQEDAGGAEQPGAVVPATAVQQQGNRPRPRYGRRRGPIPAGEAFVPRLGPRNGEPFVGLESEVELPAITRPGPETPIEQLRFVALDCETTGQTPHRLVELGALAFTVERHLLSFETLVHSNDRINPFARRIHGINSALLAGAPPVEPVLERFEEFSRGAVFVEHSADAFDTRLIGRTMGRPVDADNIDTSRLAGKLWELRDTIGLERLCAELGIDHRRPHHALADAEATAACFLKLIELGREEYGWRTLGDLLADGQPPPPRITEPGVRRGPRPVQEAAGPAAATADGQRRRRRRGGRRHRGPGEGGGTTPAAGGAPTEAAGTP